MTAPLLRTCVAGLLGSAWVFGAHAEGRPAWKGAPVEPPHACGTLETNVPGTDACIRFGGKLRLETTTRPGRLNAVSRGSAGSFRRDPNRSAAFVSADVRTPTVLGPFRAYASVGLANGRSRRLFTH